MRHPVRIVFFLILLAVGLGVYRDYGISLDEVAQRSIGAMTLAYVANRLAPSLLARAPSHLSHVESLNDYPDRDHGVAFEAPAVALEAILGIGDLKNVFMFRHLLTFLVALAGIYAVQRMAERRFSDWRIGLLAALFLVLTPRLFAESFYNSKDVVFMALFAIAMNTMIAFVLKPGFKTAFLHALASGVAIDVRIMGVLLPPATVAILIVRLLKRELPTPATCRALAVYLAAACILVIAMWPWLWSDPIGNFVQAFRNMAKFRWGGEVLYIGRFVPSTDLPWHYVLVWISITTPLLYLALFLVGAFSTLRQIASRRTHLWKGDEELQDTIFFGLFAAPIATVILLHSVLYDGWRLMYFIYPAFLLLAIKGWVSLWGNNSIRTIPRSLLAIVTVISIVHTTVWMWKAHPFQNVYFNAFAGTGVRFRYDLDYWGLAKRKALEYILKNDDSEVIYVRGEGLAFYMLDARDKKRLRYSDDSRYVITNYRGVQNRDEAKYAKDYDIFYQIRVGNEVILSILRRKKT